MSFNRARTWLVCICAGIAATAGGIDVGRGPSFSYSYSPRLALALDTNASNDGVVYVRESPENLNCSYIVPASSATPASGTVTYEFRPDAGYVIQDVALFQKATFYTTGSISGEYSTDGGATFRPFFITRPYTGTTFSVSKRIRLHYLNATNLIVRYAILRTGSSRSVQFLRDCDDAVSALSVSGTIVGEGQAMRTRGITVVNQGAVWKYLDSGSDHGAAWRDPGFNDATWPSGAAEFGYGDGDEVTVNSYGTDSQNKHITTYYRHKFVATNEAPFKRVMLGLMRDDGGVVYLNGPEIFRSNMPAGPIAFNTLALSAVDGAAESMFNDTSISPTNIVRGTNVLAVEIHQQRANSSDISFDLDLWGELEPERPVLTMARAADCAELSWNAVGFVLEWASAVTGPWDVFPGNPASPYRVCGLEQPAFFRLKQQ